jgi:hypothetical protein
MGRRNHKQHRSLILDKIGACRAAQKGLPRTYREALLYPYIIRLIYNSAAKLMSSWSLFQILDRIQSTQRLLVPVPLVNIYNHQLSHSLNRFMYPPRRWRCYLNKCAANNNQQNK